MQILAFTEITSSAQKSYLPFALRILTQKGYNANPFPKT
jgi:hypothetical protein